MFKKQERNQASKQRILSAKQNNTAKILLLALLAICSFLILSFGLVETQITSVEGDIAGEDVFYNGNTTTYTSQIRTEEARSAAADTVEQVYRIEDAILEEILLEINEDFQIIEDLQNDTETELSAKIQSLNNQLPGEYNDDLLTYVLETASFAEIINWRQNLRTAISTVYQPGLQEDELADAKEEILALIIESSLSDIGKQFLEHYLRSFSLSPNEIYDAQATSLAVEEAMQAVDMVQVTVQRGEKILSRGAAITDEQIEKLQALNMYSETASFAPYMGLGLVIVAFYAVFGYYLAFFQPRVFGHKKNIVLIGVVIILSLFIYKATAVLNLDNNGDTSYLAGYLLPVATASMLIAVLIGRHVAIFTTVLLSVFIAIIYNGQFSYSLVALAGGLASIMATSRLNQRGQFVNASIYITLANVFIIAAWGLLYNQSYSLIGWGLLFGLLNGFISAILAMGLLPFMESAFSITTAVRLLELSNSNHPLLKRLMLEAPGTYNHAILVGNLAEAAADMIGADPLLVRVGAYYHDIGKLKRPYFFIENQAGGENPHNKLQPTLSVMIITSHIREGVQMLREAKFPEEVISVVEQHHGSGFLGMFYQKALDEAYDKDIIHKEDYHYPYQKPQSKEAAILMLADSVQAAVQAIKSPEKGQVEGMVQKVIKSKVDDLQLQECPLTFRDLYEIEQAFLMVLSGMNHSRIIYPDKVALEVENRINANLPNNSKKPSPAAGATQTMAEGRENYH